MTTITLSQAVQLTGIPKSTLKWRLRRHSIRSVSYGRYDRQTILQMAGRLSRIARRAPQYHNGDPCSRCGHYDYGNTCRGGLCLDCYCHDYIAARKPLAAFKTRYQQALEAYGLREKTAK